VIGLYFLVKIQSDQCRCGIKTELIAPINAAISAAIMILPDPRKKINHKHRTDVAILYNSITTLKESR